MKKMSFIDLYEKENKEAEKRIKKISKEVEKAHRDFVMACG